MQNNITEESPHQVLTPSSIQQGHIQHYNVNALLFGEDAPLIQNLAIVAPETVNAFDVEQIVFFQSSHQLFVLRTLKVLAALLVHEDILFRDVQLTQGDKLAIFVLVLCTDTDITICISCDTINLLCASAKSGRSPIPSDFYSSFIISVEACFTHVGYSGTFFDYLLQEWEKADKMESREGRTVNSEEMGKI